MNVFMNTRAMQQAGYLASTWAYTYSGVVLLISYNSIILVQLYSLRCCSAVTFGCMYFNSCCSECSTANSQTNALAIIYSKLYTW